MAYPYAPLVFSSSGRSITLPVPQQAQYSCPNPGVAVATMSTTPTIISFIGFSCLRARLDRQTHVPSFFDREIFACLRIIPRFVHNWIAMLVTVVFSVPYRAVLRLHGLAAIETSGHLQCKEACPLYPQ